MTAAPDLAPKRAPVKEPARAWRNWWRASARFYGVISNRFREKGEAYASTLSYPSREVAEQRALDCLQRHVGEFGGPLNRDNDFYLGAFPEGERP